MAACPDNIWGNPPLGSDGPEREALVWEWLCARPRWAELRRVAAAVMQEGAEAADETVSVFLAEKLGYVLSRYDPAQPFGPFIRTCLGNYCRSLVQGRPAIDSHIVAWPEITHQDGTVSVWEPADPRAPDSALQLMEAAEKQELLDAVLASLRPEYRDVLLARDVHGLSFKQYAADKGIPAGTAGAQYYRARHEAQQAVRSRLARLSWADVSDWRGLFKEIEDASLVPFRTPARRIRGVMAPSGLEAIRDALRDDELSPTHRSAFLQAYNAMLERPDLYQEEYFASIVGNGTTPPGLREMLESGRRPGYPISWMNRLLLDLSFARYIRPLRAYAIG